jgi:hypothetical protein
MSANALLARLDRVRQTGPSRWLARCPAHEDRSPSLSIRELSDGRILLHDFGGCGTDEVLRACDLTMADLFPERLREPVGGFRRPPRIPAFDILVALAHEATVAALILEDIIERRGAVRLGEVERICLVANRLGAGAAYGRK